jgi:sugar/nucleoside kinase (ribokinase family)
MYDIITFGSAAQDIYAKSNAFKILEDKNFIAGKGICLPLGSKVDTENIVLATGGGGTNTAATFVKQGLKTAICCAIGVDVAGLEIVRELKHLRIDTRFLIKKKERQTNQSIIISNSEHEHTILVFRGASDLVNEKDINWRKIRKTKWFYLAPLTGNFAEIFEKIVSFGFENKIKIAVNPSKQQLSMPAEDLKRILAKVNVLFLNKEEASFLTKIPFDQEKEIFNKIDEICPGIVVMTKGADGVVVSDGKSIYSAMPDPSRKIVDTTGAGDSFAAGFLSSYIRFNCDIVRAIQFGLANSAANLSEIGAKTGLLDKKSDFKRVEVKQQKIT